MRGTIKILGATAYAAVQYDTGLFHELLKSEACIIKSTFLSHISTPHVAKSFSAFYIHMKEWAATAQPTAVCGDRVLVVGVKPTTF